MREQSYLVQNEMEYEGFLVIRGPHVFRHEHQTVIFLSRAFLGAQINVNPKCWFWVVNMQRNSSETSNLHPQSELD